MNTIEFWEESGELPGILNRVIAGLNRLVQNEGFTQSQSSDELREGYKYEVDSVRSFLRDEGYEPCEDEKVKMTEFYTAYRWYCTTNGLRAVLNKQLIQRLRSLGYIIKPGTGNVNYVHCRKAE